MLFIVKDRPPERFVAHAQRQGTKLVYCPLDVYRDPDHVTRGSRLRQRDCLLTIEANDTLSRKLAVPGGSGVGSCNIGMA